MGFLDNNRLIIAVDFDGTLCTEEFPKIGEQNWEQKKLMSLLVQLRNMGNKLILWTCRGDNEERKYLTEAVDWCGDMGLEFDGINANIKGLNKPSGWSPKIVADIYIDDKSIGAISSLWLETVNSQLQNIINEG